MSVGSILWNYEVLSNQTNNLEPVQLDLPLMVNSSQKYNFLENSKFYDKFNVSWSKLKNIDLVGPIIKNASNLLENNSSNKSINLSRGERVDQLISELMEESDREKDMDQIDDTFQQAEAVKAKLEAEINRSRLITMHLQSMHRNVEEAYSLAKKLVQSDLVVKDTKLSAVEQLNKCLKKVNKLFIAN